MQKFQESGHSFLICTALMCAMDLLQENSTLQRLKDEKGVLEGSVNYLRARLAVESAFTTDSSSEESAGSEGSPEGPEVTPEQ